MQEYVQIQTYIRWDPKGVPSSFINRLKIVLRKLDFPREVVDDWLQEVESDLQEKKSVHSCLFFEKRRYNYKINPYIISWQKDIYSQLEEPWIEVGLLIDRDSEDQPLFSDTTCKYELGMEKMCWEIVRLFGHLFYDTGVYLTSGVKDGCPFEGFIEKDSDKLWEFDMAFIPGSREPLYLEIPRGFHAVCLINGQGLMRANVWQKIPWVET